jgi:hypothetical protein
MPIEQHINIESIFDCEHPVARFAADCALQLEVCRSLFALADHLPGTTDREAIVYLVKALPATWAAHVAFQSEAAFPLLARRHESERHILQCLVRFDRQHIEVAGVTDELVDQLQVLLSGDAVDTETLGRLARNASERRREHVEWEAVLLDPLFPRVLAPVERQAFAAWSSANPWPFDQTQQSAVGR